MHPKNLFATTLALLLATTPIALADEARQAWCEARAATVETLRGEWSESCNVFWERKPIGAKPNWGDDIAPSVEALHRHVEACRDTAFWLDEMLCEAEN